MRAAPVLGALLLALAAGCADPAPSAGSGDPGPTQPPAPPAKQVFSAEGNAPMCTNVLVEDATFAFDVEEGYDQVEVAFHASGVGQVGFDLYAPDGSRLGGREPYNPGDQPCNHAHEGGHETYDAAPGTYTVTVKNLGLVGWHLVVNEKSSRHNATSHEH